MNFFAKAHPDRTHRPDCADPPALVTYTADEIEAMEIPPLDFAVPGIFAIGGTLLGGRPKDGKTYVMLGCGYAVATGSKAFGAISCEEGDVLMLLLEDNRKRFQRRMRQIAGDRPKPKRMTVAFQEGTERIDTGLPNQIREWAKSVRRPRLVTIDTLTAVRPLGVDKRTPFQVEYELLRVVNDLAHELEVAIVVVHHLRKSRSGDVLDDLSGTYGLAAAVDTVAGLQRSTGGFELKGRGRDIEEFEYGLMRDNGRWLMVGSATDMRMSAERRRILDVLRERGEPMTAGDVATEVGQSPTTVRQTLRRMCDDGDGVERVGRGLYRATPDTRQDEAGA